MQHGERSICPFCSMGCSLLIRPGTGAPYVGEEETPALDYDAEGRVNRGSLCAKGNMCLELLTTAKRLDQPSVRVGDALEPRGLDTALDTIATTLERIRKEHGPAAIGLLAGPYLTNEEADAVVALARRIGTPHVGFSQPEDRSVLGGLDRSGAAPLRVTDVEQLEAMTAILAVGDVFTVAPCLSRPALEARYDRRQNALGVLGFWKSRTSLFAKPRLRCRPGQEAPALVAMLLRVLARGDGPSAAWRSAARAWLQGIEASSVEEIAGIDPAAVDSMVDALCAGESTGVVLALGFAETERPDLVAGLAALLAEATGSRFLPLLSGPNSIGVRRRLLDAGLAGTRGYTAPEMGEAAGTGDLRALLAFGCDPLGSVPGRIADEATSRLELLTVSAPLPCETMCTAHVALAAATWGEKSGTVENSFGHEQALRAIFPPPGAARADGELLEALTARLAPATAVAQASRLDASTAGAAAFFDDVELHLRLERRSFDAPEIGRHLLFPEYAPSQAADGALTSHLSWPRHELPGPTVALSPRRAHALGVEPGETVWVRSGHAEAQMTVRLELNLPDDVVLAPPHFPEVRRLTRWRVDPTLHDLDVRPGRVSVEVLEGGDA